ncbi:pathogen-associated molecular patterns-induced protein A70 [Capsicum chacoense]
MFDDFVSTVYSSIWASMNSWFTPTVLFALLNVMIGIIAFTSSLNHPKQQQQPEDDYSPSQPQQQQQEDHSHNQPQQGQPPSKLARSPSLLQRIKSINFYNYRSQEPVKDYNFDHPHQQETPFEPPPTHYIFEPGPEHTTIEPDSTTTQYILDQENVQKARTQYENLPDTQTQYLFQHTHEENREDMETHFDFQQIQEEDNEDEDELKSLDEVYSQLTEHHVSRSRSDRTPSAGEVPAKMKKSASMKSPFAHFEEEEAIVEARRPATTRERNAKTSDGDTEVDAKADDFINKFKQQLKLQRVDSNLRYTEMLSRGS